MSDTALSFPTQTQAAFEAGINSRAVAANVRHQYAAQVITAELAIAAVDVISITLAAMVTITGYTILGGSTADCPSTVGCVAFVLSVVLFFRCCGLYKPGIHPVYEVRKLLFVIAGASLLAGTHPYTAGQRWQIMLGFLPVAAMAVPLARSFGRSLLARQEWWGVRCLVFGAERRIESLYKQHMVNAKCGLKPVGFLQDTVPPSCPDEIFASFHGRAHRTTEAADKQRVSCALVHRCGRNDNDIQQFIEEHLQGFTRVVFLSDDPRLPSLWTMGAAGYSIEDNLLKPSAQLTKRVVDVAVSLSALVFGFPAARVARTLD